MGAAAKPWLHAPEENLYSAALNPGAKPGPAPLIKEQSEAGGLSRWPWDWETPVALGSPEALLLEGCHTGNKAEGNICLISGGKKRFIV